MRTLRIILVFFIAILPFNHLRIRCYRFLLNYDIDFDSYVSAFTFLFSRNVLLRSAQIGPLNILKLDTLHMDVGSRIGKLNFISKVKQVHLKRNAMILHRNFIGGTHGTEVCCQREDLLIGENSQISISCFIDLSDRITLGCNVVVAGAGTQFWTHGFDHLRKRSSGEIVIHDNVFIGSASTLVHGIDICSDVVIGAGSVVHKSIAEPGLYVSSQLRRIR